MQAKILLVHRTFHDPAVALWIENDEQQALWVAGGMAMALSALQVWKARWNGVQVVAVKQLRSAASQKAQLDFMREV